MKTLYIQVLEKATLLFFKGSNNKITLWVARNLDNPALKLNEPHSCNVELWGNEILVKGNEDSLIFEIKKVKPIEL